MTLNLDLSGVQSSSNKRRTLEPWKIHPVKFTEARKETIQGVKDPTASYDVLKVRFDGENGYYEESIFYPKDGDDVRPTYTNAQGHEYQGASSFERTMSFIAQVANALNPEGYKKLQEASSKFKTFDQVVQAFIKILEPVKGKETNLKLIGRTRDGYVNAALPKFVAVNKNGELFVSDNFIGDNLFFSEYEQQRMKNEQAAKPTVMNPDKIEGSEDFDINSLL